MVYIYAYICREICTHICMHTHMHIYIYTHMYYMNTDRCMCIHMHEKINSANMYTCACVCINHIYMHIYILTYIYICICICIILSYNITKEQNNGPPHTPVTIDVIFEFGWCFKLQAAPRRPEISSKTRSCRESSSR